MHEAPHVLLWAEAYQCAVAGQAKDHQTYDVCLCPSLKLVRMRPLVDDLMHDIYHAQSLTAELVYDLSP